VKDATPVDGVTDIVRFLLPDPVALLAVKLTL
jgi:hypothetical protein